MKKQLKLIILLSLIFSLTSCITSQEEVLKAKQNLWIVDGQVNNSQDFQEENMDNNIVENTSEEENKGALIETWWIDEIEDVSEKENKEIKKEETKKIEIKSLTDNQFLEFDDLSNKDLLWWAVEITGKTLDEVDKIIVTFKNETSDFPDDRFQLKQFKAWDPTFLYRAFSKYETLDYWKNIYVFEAYKWDEVTKLELIFNVFEDEKEEKTKDLEKLDISKLPKNEKFWNPIEIWDWKIAYTDLRWLEIKWESISWLKCENLTDILKERIKWYFYWNTCRPVNEKEWISFYVIRLKWDKYIYEKDYYLDYMWVYWVQELETWTWVTIENIWEKNSELKEKNENYAILNVTDDLFKEILK